MSYTVPPAPKPPKDRYQEVTDAGEIAAIQRGEYGDPIGHQRDGRWWAEVGSLRQFRGRVQLADGGARD